ncbi:MAG: SBBP repeat-containing protein, partial [Actinomycetota bacterium]|nr:SBBP repeat-containing protein [Actinomycetota bacterium]
MSQLPGVTNYMVGADRSRWHLGIPTFGQVRYQGVYPGIDMVYHGNQSELEYDLVVAPGSNPARIAIAYHGARSLSISHGALLIRAPGGTILQHRPVIYQGSGVRRHLVTGHYVLQHGGTRVGFRIGAYDHSHPLVIDPSISYSTFLGGYNQALGNGSATTLANGIAVDSSGDAFVVGFTDSVAPTPFPTSAGAYQTTLNPGGPPRDAFVTKLNPAGNGILYSTYLGGGGEDRATGVAVGPNGNAYVSGFTSAGTFPTTTGAYQTTYGGGARDAFFTELNATGTALVYSTLLGGSGSDTATRIAVDSSGNAYLVGNTSPTAPATTDNFPTSAGAFQAAFGGSQDAFVAKISPAAGGATDLSYSTFLGGSASDSGASIAVDAAGEAYVTGGTASANEFSTFNTATYGAFQPALNGGTNGNAYVAKLNASGTNLLAATFLGGSGNAAAGGDSAAGIGLDSTSNVYVAGATASNDFPTKNAAQPANASASGSNADDSFVTKLAPDLKSLGYSTYNGGVTYDIATDIAVDPAGNAYAVGDTLGSPPLKNPVQVRTGDYDAFLTKYDPSGQVVYSTIYGGGARDFINGVAADSAGNAYIAGRSDFFSPSSFPIKNAFQPLNGGFANAFAAMIGSAPTAVLVNSLRSRGGPVVGGTTVVLSGTGFTGATAVSFGGTAAASFTVNSDTQITAVSPAHAAGQVNVTVTAPGGTSPANQVTLYEFAQGLWSLTGSLHAVHYDQQMTLLNDGRVLLVAGQNSMFGDTIASTEIYSPLTGAWTQTGSLNTARSAYTLTRLDGPACRSTSPASYCGSVLVAGGSPNNAGSGSTALNTAEIYSPSTGAWTFTTGNLNTAREQAAATLLDGPECHAASPPAYCGEVLISGGFNPATATTYNTAELYDPATRTFSNTASFQHTARLFQSVLLPNGKVLIAGGTGSNPAATEVYNPASGTWGTTGAMNIGRQRNTLILLQDGRVLAASGTPPGDPPQLGTPQQAGDSAEVYDPSTGVWTLVPNRLFGATRDNHDSAVLPSGQVLLADGGRGGITSELFNPGSGTFDSAGLLNISRGSGNPQSGSFYAVVLSSDPNSFAASSAVCGNNCGKVLVAGNTDTATAELYTPAPRVDGLTPATGAGTGGTSVTITGLGFTHGVRSVLFGSTPATSFTVNAYGQLTAVAPPGTGSVKIAVVNDGGQATSSDTFAYQSGGVVQPPPPPT